MSKLLKMALLNKINNNILKFNLLIFWIFEWLKWIVTNVQISKLALDLFPVFPMLFNMTLF